MDILAFPTFREGFPGVPLEAQAAQVPVVTTNATGAAESVLHGSTGLIVPVGDKKALESALASLLDDPHLRRKMGMAGRQWVSENFKPQTIWGSFIHEYDMLLAETDNGEKWRTSAMVDPEHSNANLQAFESSKI